MREARKQEEPVDTPGPEWVSLNEATKIVGVNREAVLQLGLAGTLKVQRFGRWTFVSRESIDRHLATVGT